MTSKIKIGDIFEIECDGTYAYAMYTHHDKLMGALIQIPKIRFSNKQLDFNVKNFSILPVFFPLQTVLNKGVITKISNIEIPEQFSKFPLFRAGVYLPEAGIIQKPLLWDGTQSFVPDAHFDIEKLPIKEAISYPQLLSIVCEFPI